MAMEFQPSCEHRRYPRLEVVHLDVYYQPGGFIRSLLLPEGRISQRALAYDLSERGMRLVSQAPVGAADLLILRPRAAFVQAPISLKGRVVRCRRVPDGTKGPLGRLYEWGVKLTRVGEGYLSILQGLRRDAMLIRGM